ncbi:MAG: hypothetical protein KF817_07705 [Phycisphaeraceae bacterium]|nr:hypothetical protein [Phycisphaeraceae bacterium]
MFVPRVPMLVMSAGRSGRWSAGLRRRGSMRPAPILIVLATASGWACTAHARWTATNLHPDGAQRSGAMAVQDGQQAGYATIGGIQRAGAWSSTAGSWVDLSISLSGSWSNSFAYGIWSDGLVIPVVGVGRNLETGRDEALLWTNVIDQAPLPGDVTGDGVVNMADMLAVLGAWGDCPDAPGDCPADIAPPPHGDGQVDLADLLIVLSNWA